MKNRTNPNQVEWGWTRLVILLLLSPVSAGAEEPAKLPAEDDPNEIVYWSSAEFPAATRLLAEVRAAFPRERLQLQAELVSKNRVGTQEQVLHAEMSLDWRGEEKSAEYTIRDAFGADLEKLNIRLRPEQPADLRYTRGDSTAISPPPTLAEPIQDTDVTWQDLTLAYLWWPGGQTVDAEKVKGRFCYVVDLPAPSNGPSPSDGVRLWIDPKAHVLLKAEQRSEAGDPTRRLEIKSFKRINGIWMVKDLEVVSLPARHRTAIRVTSMSVRSDRPEDQPVPIAPVKTTVPARKPTPARPG